ncbi:MAG TPA: XRE family transcriptional regulator [Acidimicrobiaceae bacterium]|nr:XRE family transcriptional regulator [Acidimicrobiaceae bacterium]
MAMGDHIEATTRARLRALRQRAGWSLDQLAERAGLSPSTLSRIETGRRTISLDVLVPLARALGVALDELLAADDDGDVVIRPTPTGRPGLTTWVLSRPGATMTAVKMRFEPVDTPPEQQVHPGHDWMFVLTGVVRLTLGERQFMVRAGEAAEFSTMTPHAVQAVGRRAEVIMVFDRDGERAHVLSQGER